MGSFFLCKKAFQKLKANLMICEIYYIIFEPNKTDVCQTYTPKIR
jgi:hypothetical protein